MPVLGRTKYNFVTEKRNVMHTDVKFSLQFCQRLFYNERTRGKFLCMILSQHMLRTARKFESKEDAPWLMFRCVKDKSYIQLHNSDSLGLAPPNLVPLICKQYRKIKHT